MNTSFNQESYLVLSEMYGQSSAVKLAFGLAFERPLDRVALEAALASVVGRHDSLRAGFTKSPSISLLDRRVRMQVYANTGLLTPGLYSQHLSDSAEIQIGEGSGGEAWDYSRAPMMRASVSDLPGGETLLTVSVPPLICDLKSLRVLQLEIAAAYRVGVAAEQPQDKDRVLQFPAFASWQNSASLSGYFDASVDYWRSVLDRFEQHRVRDGELGFGQAAGAAKDPVLESIRFDEDLTEKLGDLARSAECSLQTFLLALFATWMAAEIKRSPICFWLHFANRTLPGSQNAVGWFANTHMFVVDVPADLTGRGIVEHVSHAYSKAEAHQEIPPPCLWSKLGRAPSATGPRVSLTIIGSAREDSPSAEPPTPRIRSVFIPQSGSAQPRNDCRFVAILENGGVTIRVAYTGGYSADVIGGWLRNIRRLADEFVLQKSSRLSFLTASATEEC